MRARVLGGLLTGTALAAAGLLALRGGGVEAAVQGAGPAVVETPAGRFVTFEVRSPDNRLAWSVLDDVAAGIRCVAAGSGAAACYPLPGSAANVQASRRAP